MGRPAFRDQLQGQVPPTASSLSLGPQEELVPAAALHPQPVLTWRGEVGVTWPGPKDLQVHGLGGGVGGEVHKEHEAGLLNFHATGSSVGEVEIQTRPVGAGEAWNVSNPS